VKVGRREKQIHPLDAYRDDADPVSLSRNDTFPDSGIPLLTKIIVQEMTSGGPTVNLCTQMRRMGVCPCIGHESYIQKPVGICKAGEQGNSGWVVPNVDMILNSKLLPTATPLQVLDFLPMAEEWKTVVAEDTCE
jgi:hypothetical protein